jgi:hypothetical protein
MSNGTPAETKPRAFLRPALWIVAGLAVLFWITMVARVGGLAVERGGPATGWAVSIIFTIALLALAGHEVNDRWFGVLIDARNKFSLARLQITMWTVMVMTAYLTIVIPRIQSMAQGTMAQPDALNIKFPTQLILAMGISAVSFAGASLIKSNKTSKTTTIDLRSSSDAAEIRRNKAKTELDTAEGVLFAAVQTEGTRKDELDKATTDADGAKTDGAKATAEAAMNQAKTMYTSAVLDTKTKAKERDAKKAALEAADQDLVAAKSAEGLLHRNASPSDASWVDLVRGEEIGNYKLVDMSKVQMLFFTVVVIATYAGSIVALLYNGTLTSGEISLPPFDETLNALLGISHGTYLSVKAVDHS